MGDGRGEGGIRGRQQEFEQEHRQVRQENLQEPPQEHLVAEPGPQKRPGAERLCRVRCHGTLWASTDVDGVLLEVSPAWTRLLGYSPLELAEAPLWTRLHPNDEGAARKAADGLLFQGAATARFSGRFRTKSGGYVCLGWRGCPDVPPGRFAWIVIALSGAMAASGSGTGLESTGGSFSGIAPHHTRLAGARADAMAMAGLAGFCLPTAGTSPVWTPEVRQLLGMAPDSGLTLQSVGEVLDRHRDTYQATADRPKAASRLERMVERARHGGGAWAFEARVSTANDLDRWVSCRGEGVSDRHGHLIVRGTLQDVSAEKAAERGRNAIQRVLSELYEVGCPQTRPAKKAVSGSGPRN